MASLSDRFAVDDPSYPRKLKDSCTDCATSKVKCTREKPTCQRCARRGRRCEYATSRRSGGHSSAKSVTSQDTTASSRKQSNSQPSETGHNSAALTPWDPGPMADIFNTDQSSFLLWPEKTSPDLPSMATPWTKFTDQANPNYDDLNSLFELIPPPAGKDVVPFSDLENSDSTAWMTDISMITSGPEAMNVDPAPVAPIAVMTAPQGSSNSGPAETSEDNCLATATTVLLSLFPQTKSTSGPILAYGTALDTNRRAINTLITILECKCSKDRYLLSILSLILHKVMGWYRAISDRAGPSTVPTLDYALSERNQHGRFSGEVVSGTEASVDAESSNEQDRRAAQVVMGELHNVQRLLKLLSSRLREVSLQDEYSSYGSGSSYLRSSQNQSTSGTDSEDDFSGTAELSESMFNCLDTEIQSRFRALSGATIEKLRMT